MKQRRWPVPAESALQRRTQIARSYRAALLEIAPDRCAVLDRAAEALGENWVTPTLISTDEETLTLTDCAEQLGVKVGTLWAWANRGVVPRLDDGRFDLAVVQQALAARTHRATRVA
jgi:hypothetical protein